MGLIYKLLNYFNSILSIGVICFHTIICDAQTCLPNGVQFSSQAEIDDFAINYPGCTDILGDVTIEDVFDVDNLIGLSQVERIRGNLKIFAVYELSDLEGLDNLEFVNGDLEIRLNGFLSNFQHLAKLKSVAGKCWISSNEKVTDFKGLENLNSIGGTCDISNHRNLESLEGFNNLESVGNGLFIYNNKSMTTISALSKLKTVNGYFDVGLNESLYNLSGLDNIDPNSIEGLHLIGLPAIENCAVKSICDYLKKPNPNEEIRDNKYGCNTAEQILENCLTVGVDYFKKQKGLSPNPTLGIIKLDLIEHTSLSIYNNFGVELRKWNGFQMKINISDLNPGMYFLAIHLNEETSVHKVVKL